MSSPIGHEHSSQEAPAGPPHQADPYPGQPYGQAPGPRTNPMAIAGLVCAFLVWPAGIVLSAIGLRQIKRTGERGRGLALAGLIVSIVAGVVSIILTILAVVAGIAATNELERQDAIRESIAESAASPDEDVPGLTDPTEEPEPVAADGPAGADDASLAACEAILGDDPNSLFNLFTETSSLSDEAELLAHADKIVTRMAEAKALAPEAMHADLELLDSSIVAMLSGAPVTDQLSADVETAVTNLGTYCTGA
ncbi:DUF4190 domain-containing protein [Georgenia thermotolerans]|uniref:DUF4190 domain-containing protein n=1 Tax=Georgenia thermotolerans TaxID=527326 RepID=A0A7J5UL86_9MICO|nr:DUF4190 domain-containing protein [Georgenia thermotolerans]KAE8762653.1 DUF4190 domain-containing protein [Georgenia thermotolerans]